MSTEVKTQPLVASSPPGSSLRRGLVPKIILVLIIIMALIFLFTTPGITNINSLRSVLLGGAFVGMIAVGQSAIMVSGNFVSMALGTQVAVGALVFLWSLQWGLVAAIVICLVAGIAISGVQGYAMGAFGANPIILTIGMSVLLEGLTVIITKGATVHNVNAVKLDWLTTPVFGIAPPVLALILVTIIAELYLRRIRTGVSAYLLGTNAKAAKASGLSATTISIGAFALAGAACAICSIMLGSFQGSGSLSLEGSLTFDSIAAVLVGGVSVAGGRGSAIGAALGAIVISAVDSALLIRGVPEGAQILVKGLVVVIAVILVRSLSRETSR